MREELQTYLLAKPLEELRNAQEVEGMLLVADEVLACLFAEVVLLAAVVEVASSVAAVAVALETPSAAVLGASFAAY
jgi:hypothetical protein